MQALKQMLLDYMKTDGIEINVTWLYDRWRH